MNKREQRRRANRIIYQRLQQTLDGGLERSEPDETPTDLCVIEDIIDKRTQWFFEHSDLAQETERGR